MEQMIGGVHLILGKNGSRTQFLREGIDYTFPDYIFILRKPQNLLFFNLLVEDVLPNSKKLEVDNDEKTVCVKFCVIKLDPNECKHYGFMVKLPVECIERADCIVSRKRVQVKFRIRPNEDLKWFLCGLTDSKLEKKIVQNYQVRIIRPNSPISSPDVSDDDDDDDWKTTEL